MRTKTPLLHGAGPKQRLARRTGAARDSSAQFPTQGLPSRVAGDEDARARARFLPGAQTSAGMDPKVRRTGSRCAFGGGAYLEVPMRRLVEF